MEESVTRSAAGPATALALIAAALTGAGDISNSAAATRAAPPKPLDAIVTTDAMARRVRPASLCGEPNYAAITLACGGLARAPRAAVIAGAGSMVTVRLGASAAGLTIRRERALDGGRLERLTHDLPLTPMRGSRGRVFRFATDSLWAGARTVIVFTVRYRQPIPLGIRDPAGIVVREASAEFALRLGVRR